MKICKNDSKKKENSGLNIFWKLIVVKFDNPYPDKFYKIHLNQIFTYK